VGGTAVYDGALARIGQRLAAADRAGARDTAAWALSLAHPCLAPYYARLVFVHWGLTRLQAPAGARELADLIEAAAAANRTEKALGKRFLNDGLRDKAREVVRDSAEGRFWHDWLTTCDALGPGPRGDAGKVPERSPAPRVPRAEQVLADGLAQWAAKAPASRRRQ